MRKIEVYYDGEYPCACTGRLIIKIDNGEIYNEDFCCTSTGSLDEDYEVIEGTLTCDDAEKFDIDIQKAVEEKISEINVCCGGCI